jgi:uncharacterized membrane protein (DUF485 family)
MNEQYKINREEFIQFWKKRDRATTGGKGGLFLLLYITCMLLFAIPMVFFAVDKHPAILIAWFPLFFGYLIVFPSIWTRIFAGKAVKHFLKCPQCGRSFRNNINRMIMTATGKCGFCGEEVFTKRIE